MNDIRHDDSDRFAALLASAARPTTSPSSELTAAIADVARSIAAPRTRRRVPVVAAVLAPLLVLSGAGAAFAASGVDWSSFWSGSHAWTGWATHPDASITYRLPSGASCTMRFGGLGVSAAAELPAGVPKADPSAADETRRYLDQGTMLQDVTVAQMLAEDRAKDVNWTTDSDGKEVRFGYGTANYDADVEYSIAVKDAVQVAITRHLERAGISSTGLTYMSQEQCSGTDR